MASLHFIARAPIVAREGRRELGRNVTLEIEVEGSAGVKSRADLMRAARAIAAGQIARGFDAATEELGDFTLTETKEISKAEQSPLTSAEWRGVTIWRVSADPRLAA